MFLDNRNTPKKITDLVSQGKGLRLAVAFWGEGAICKLGIDKQTEAKIICNLDTGATNPHEIEKLLEEYPNIEIRTLSGLHSKVYLGSNKAVIGSSNASSNGLNFTDEEINRLDWIEANYLVSDPEHLGQIRTWFSKIWKEAAEITDYDIKRALKAWERRRGNRSFPLKTGQSQRKTLLKTLQERPENLKDRQIYISRLSDSDDSEPRKLTKLVEKKTKDYGDETFTTITYFWDELKKPSDLKRFGDFYEPETYSAISHIRF